MTNIDISFSRNLLALVARDVRAYAPHIKTQKHAWVWCAGRDHWEFHGPENYFWHGSASNAYDARAKGWQAWLNKTYPQYEEELNGIPPKERNEDDL